MNEQTKRDILAWAQTQVESWPVHEEDWWGAYNDEWDINIWDTTVFGDGEPGGVCVTAYRIVKGGNGDLLTDMEDSVSVGRIEVTA